MSQFENLFNSSGVEEEKKEDETSPVAKLKTHINL